jgi:hypothetical protein
MSKHFEKIEFKTIPHELHRYETVGDYWKESQVTKFRVSRMSDWRYEALVFVHELIEYIIVKYMEIPLKDIDNFDEGYELAREMKIKAPCGCKPTKDSEPGFDSHSPYNSAHYVADRVEHLLAFIIGVKWSDYNKEVVNL